MFSWALSLRPKSKCYPGRILIQKSVSKFKLTCSIFQRLQNGVLFFLLVTEDCSFRILTDVFTLFFHPTKSQAVLSLASRVPF